MWTNLYILNLGFGGLFFIFFKSTNSQYFFTKIARIDPLAQPIWLSGCPTKGQFIAENTKNAFLVAQKRFFY